MGKNFITLGEYITDNFEPGDRLAVVIKFQEYRTEDNFVVATIIFVKKDPEGPCLLTQAMVPRHFARMASRSA